MAYRTRGMMRSMRAATSRALSTVMLVACASCVMVPVCIGQKSDTGLRVTAAEFDVKAALLMHLGKLVTWPEAAFESETSPFVIAVVGPDPFGEALRKLEGRIVRGRRIRTRYYETMKDYKPCHILYCNLAGPDQVRERRSRLARDHVLTVGGAIGFAERSGIVEAAVTEGHLELKINLAAARKADLRLEAGLLALATVVGGPHDAAEEGP